MSQMIYGVHPVSEALHLSHHQIEKIVIGSPKPSPALQGIIDLASRNHVPVTFSSKESLDQMTGGGLHQNVVMFMREASSYCSLDELLAYWKKEGNRGLFLILDEIQDPQNFGALVRTALGCGAHGVIIPKDRAVGVTPAAVKASAGATAHMKIARVVNIANTIETLKKEGIWVYGAALEGKDLLYDLDFDIDLAIVI
jgi:23S rRNA (guanosine2251-2'-O)-methyltransferase